MLEEKIETLTDAIKALTDAMERISEMPLGATLMSAGEEAPVESSDISEIDREDLSKRTLALVRKDPAYRQDIRDMLASLGAKKVPDLTGDDLVAYADWIEQKEQE